MALRGSLKQLLPGTVKEANVRRYRSENGAAVEREGSRKQEVDSTGVRTEPASGLIHARFCGSIVPSRNCGDKHGTSECRWPQRTSCRR
jgi:hypothetical protein